MSERGRGRGRGRSQDDKKSHSQYPGQYQPSSQPQTSAWGRKPGGSQAQPGPSSQTPYSRPPVPQNVGRSTQRLGSKGDSAPGYKEESRSEPMEVCERGDIAALGRGAMRGRRVIVPDILTKPEGLVTKKGTTGNRVMLQANYFKLLTTTDWCLYQYRVDFSPEEDRTAVRKGLLRLHKETVGAYVFDGTVLYTSKRIQDNLELYSVRLSDDTKIRITIRLVGDMVKGDQHYIQFFNIIMRKCLDLLKLQLVGRDYFDARSKVEIRDFRMELWPGYYTSVRQNENNILMCAEITHKIMRQETLLDILNDCYERSPHNFKTLYGNEVIGLTVLTDYNNNTYRITDVDYDTNPRSTFKLRDGESISYLDYYRNKYKIKIHSETQPMLVTRAKQRERRADQPDMVYLVPELCRATGLTDNMRSNFNLMNELAKHTRISAKLRIDKLLMFNRRLRQEKGVVQELQDWNMKLDDKLVDIPARILPSETIVLGHNVKVPAGQFADWSRELQTKPLFNAARLRNWVVVGLNRMRRDIERFVRTIQENAQGMSFGIDMPRFLDINDDRSNTYTDILEKIMSSSNPELVLCIVSNNRSDRYAAIKKKCTVDRPVPSQVILAKQLTNKNMRTIATKVAIQINCKLGGAPWSVELPPINLMVVGFDVCHDPNDRSRDFGAMVASLDKSLTRYFSAVSPHKSGEELSNEFSVNLAKALNNYREMNKCLPSHIVIYRDGVGEGQVPYVYEHEVQQIKTKLNSIYANTGVVKMAYVIVTKGIRTRVFHNQDNPPPGTIIDDVITNPLRYDFYVVSQKIRVGTVTPCAYNVIADTTGWRADQMQRMTYKLCHMYYNWSGTVRVPAPCQYAHKLAFFVAQYIRRSPSTQMENLLYYL